MPLQVDTLLSQHKHLLDLVKVVDALDPRTNAPTIADHLGQFKTALLAHLETEDHHLYPALRDAGGRPDAPLSLKTNINQFFDEMEAVKPAVVAFLGKYSASSIAADPAGFRRDFAGIVEVLGGRIAREEARLYPLYTKHVTEAVAR